MRLRTLGLVVTLAMSTLVVPLIARAHQAGRVWRIGLFLSRVVSLISIGLPGTSIHRAVGEPRLSGVSSAIIEMSLGQDVLTE